jgi:hypothetical protein
MKLTYEQFKKYIEDNGVTDARTTENWHCIPKGTLIKFGFDNVNISSYRMDLKGQEQYTYSFDIIWSSGWGDDYKGLFEVEDKELGISVKTQDEWNAVVKKMLDDPKIGMWGNDDKEIHEHYFEEHEGGAVLYSEKDCNYKILRSSFEWYKNNYPNIPLQSAQEYLGYDPNEKLKPMLDGYVYTYDGEIFKDRCSTFNCKFTPEEINKLWTAGCYGKSVDEFVEEMKSYKYSMEFNQLTKPKGNKYMSIISNAFKSKENKALEYFNLGTTETLSERGRQEFIDFLWETLKEEKKAFLSKMVEAYKEDK